MKRRIVQSVLNASLIALMVAGLAAAILRGHWHLPADGASATRQTLACRDIDPSWNDIAVDLAAAMPLAPGRAIRSSDGVVAALIVITAVDDQGAATTFDFSASVRISAVIIKSAGRASVIEIDPPSRNGTELGTADRRSIASVSLCYRIVVPPPPRAGTPPAGPTPLASPTPSGPRPSPTPTVEAYEVAAIETARALATEVAGAQATAVTMQTAAAAQAATHEAERFAMRATSDALATVNAAVEQTATAQQTALAAAHASATAEAAGRATTEARAAQASATAAALAKAATQAAADLATARAEQTSAAATVAAIMTAAAAPTATPTPSPAIYEASKGSDFAAWVALPDGWRVEGNLLVYDGRRFTAYAEPPVHPAGRLDHAVEIEFRIVEPPDCGTNFGIVIRGSDAGYYAGGLEWNCAPTLLLWTPQQSIAQAPIEIDESWHTLQIAADGQQITVSLDGTVVIQREDFSQPSGTQVALWSDGVALEIRSFREIGL